MPAHPRLSDEDRTGPVQPGLAAAAFAFILLTDPPATWIGQLFCVATVIWLYVVMWRELDALPDPAPIIAVRGDI